MSARLRKAGLPYLLLLPGLGWLAVFFLIPLGYMAFESLKEGTLETGFIFSWQFSNYTDAISDYNEQFLRSFEYAALATIAALLIGYPLAYFIAFRGGKWRNAMLLAVIAPFFVTYLIRTLSWETILSDSGFVVSTLKTVGILGEDGRLLDTTFSVVAGITYNFLPFMILPLYASLERIDHRLLEAGYDLYGRRRDVFLRVTLPLSMPGVVAGSLLTFIPSAGDFINAELLGTPNQYMIGNVIQSRYLEIGDYPTAAALSFILMARDAGDRADLGAHRGHRGAAGRRGGGALDERPAPARRHGGRGEPEAGATRPRAAAPGGRRAPRRGKLLDWGLNLYALLALLYLLVPIAVILVFSFNNPVGRFNFVWQEFSFEAWTDPFGVPGIGDALLTSVEIAALSTLAATALGTITALALVRYEFKGRAPVNFFIFVPLATPEVVLGAALLSMFLNFLVATGFGTILIAHIMFNLSFVIITVRSRLIGFDRSLEEAAQDLGATAWQTFRLITLPLIMPGVVSAALLAFALSIDDFVITNFNAGSTITFPLFIWGAARVAVPPQIYVIASMIFLVTLALMLLTVWQQRRAEKMAAVRPEPEEE